MTLSLMDAVKDEKEALALLKVLAENSFDSMCMTDASKRPKIVYVNNAFKRLTGYDPKAVVGKSPTMLQGKGTDPKVLAKVASCLKSGKKFEGKAINYKKDGTPFIMHWRVLPVKVGRKVVAWVAIQREAGCA